VLVVLVLVLALSVLARTWCGANRPYMNALLDVHTPIRKVITGQYTAPVVIVQFLCMTCVGVLELAGTTLEQRIRRRVEIGRCSGFLR